MVSMKQRLDGRSVPSDERNSSIATYGPAVVIAIGLLLFVVAIWRNHFFLHDDAFISLKYARNLLEYGELSWNLGERVEGYTNFLYVLMTAGLMKIGFEPLTALRVINGSAVCLFVASLYFGAKQLAQDQKLLHALAVALGLGNVSLAVWLFGGLEAPVSAALIGWAVAVLMAALTERAHVTRYAALSGAFLALAILTRPDAVIIVIFATVGLVLTARGQFKRNAWSALLVAGIPLVVFLIHMGWRYSYYGDVVPNTFHAKVGLELSHRLGKVADYFLKSATLYLPVLVCAGLSTIVALIWGRISKPAIVLLSVCLGFLAYVLWSGGDHMAAARVLLPMAGPAALLCIATLATLQAPKAGAATLVILAVLTAASVNARSFRMDWAAYNGSVVGRYIEEAWPVGSLVGLNTAGSTPFYAPSHRFIDMLGLNDRTIALREDVPVLARRQNMPGHGKGDGAYVISRAPDYLILGGSEGIDIADAEKWFLTGVELRGMEEFGQCYAMEQKMLDVPPSTERARPGVKTVSFTYYRRTCPD
ncbi:glycosyltransferase family 39 protein [Salipiger sp. PrR002]|uniref:ArnT family glycosyltransferase n=1 Tax=Salipiger sp. PrR002 TaxID=2706489 RepID=UPI0013B9D37F|nr:hypothetical protein [Salipiger sp. PrR002]NDW01742.1 hypothetical protein [Salipiger sp. PrR002]